jgi:hypothetical protein
MLEVKGCNQAYVSDLDVIELTEVELLAVSGGIMCSTEPMVQLAMYLVTGGLTMHASPPFVCVD